MFKSKLQYLCQRNSWNLPEYTTVKYGPDHNSRFSTTVVVNGVPFESPKCQIRSSKEAQNQAAKLAFDHFTDPRTIFPIKSISTSFVNNPVLSSSGLSTSNSNLVVRPANQEILQPTQKDNAQAAQANKITVFSKEDKRSKDMPNLYKNQLQQYAQKKNNTLPEYSYESDGPPHTRFNSRVTIDGRTYETLQFFSTLKEAENAAAKVAVDSWSCDEVQEDVLLYKNLLQELAQKEGFLFPTYDTIKSGLSHMPIFVSTVQIEGRTFQGLEAKNKKQAEMNAAKTAYTSLMERWPNQNPRVLCPDGQVSVAAGDLQQNIGKKAKLASPEEHNTEDKDTDINPKRYKCSSSSNTPYISLYDPFSTPSEFSTNSVRSDTEMPAGAGSLPCSEVSVCPSKSTMGLPDRCH